jgi:hypothetical protein
MSRRCRTEFESDLLLTIIPSQKARVASMPTPWYPPSPMTDFLSDFLPIHLLHSEHFKDKTDINHKFFQGWINGISDDAGRSDPFATPGTSLYKDISDAMNREMESLEKLEMVKLKVLLEALREVYEEIVDRTRSIMQKKAILSPIQQLPAELLIRIFEFLPPAAYPVDRRGYGISYHWSTVCRKWFVAFRGCSRLWRRIFICESETSKFSSLSKSATARKWLEKHRSHPLEAGIFGKFHSGEPWNSKAKFDSFLTIKAVFQESSQLSSLILDFSLHDTSESAKYIHELRSNLSSCLHAATKLEHLLIRIECHQFKHKEELSGSEDEDEEVDTGKYIDSRFFSEMELHSAIIDLPNLRSLILKGIAIKLISDGALKASSLRHLGVEDAVFVDFLASLNAWVESFPQLEELAIRGCSSAPPARSPSLPFTKLYLIQTRRATQTSFGLTRALLCCCSRLTELVIDVGYLRFARLPELPSVIRLGIRLADESWPSEEFKCKRKASDDGLDTADSWVVSFLGSVAAMTCIRLLIRDSEPSYTVLQIMSALFRDFNSRAPICPELRKLDWTWFGTDQESYSRMWPRRCILKCIAMFISQISYLSGLHTPVQTTPSTRSKSLDSNGMLNLHGLSRSLICITGVARRVAGSRHSRDSRPFNYTLRNWSKQEADVIDASFEELAEALSAVFPITWPIPHDSTCSIINHEGPSHGGDVSQHEVWCTHNTEGDPDSRIPGPSRRCAKTMRMSEAQYRVYSSTWEGFLADRSP